MRLSMLGRLPTHAELNDATGRLGDGEDLAVLVAVLMTMPAHAARVGG